MSTAGFAFWGETVEQVKLRTATSLWWVLKQPGMRIPIEGFGWLLAQ